MRVVVVAACVLAFALRMVRLDEPTLRWDEGFSIAHASLEWRELLRVAALDWHPPLYTLLLKGWMVASGKSVFAVRYLSVLLGVLAVPLAAQVGLRWAGRLQVGAWAALFAATWPLLVYYGQVTRMYPLVVVMVLLAAWGLLRGRTIVVAVGMAGAMYSLYYAIWPLAALYAWGFAADRRRWRTLLLAGVAALALYVPWVGAAADAVLFRTAASSAGLGPADYLWPTFDGLLFVYGTERWVAVAAVGLVLAAGVGLQLGPHPAAARSTSPNGRGVMAMPLLVVVVGVVGLVLGASRSGWFAVRHLAPVAPFLGLALAWALDRAARWRPVLAGLLALALFGAYWPTASSFVYEKTLEVVDPFDPTADYRYLAQHARPGDRVFFNVLPIAGWYEQLRGPSDPLWDHAMRWDPIVEPMSKIEPRLNGVAALHERLWFVLYKGDFGTNRGLVDWIEGSTHLYPAGGEWREDTLYRLFVAPRAPLARRLSQPVDFGPYRLALAEVANGDATVGVELTWLTVPMAGLGTATLGRLPDRKVFVHAVDAAGRLVGQHDGLPANDRRPQSTWVAYEPVIDRHGLSLPIAARPVELRVGLYDPVSGLRERTTAGADYVSLGLVR